MKKRVIIISLILLINIFPQISFNDITVGWIARLPGIDYVWGSTQPDRQGWPAEGSTVTWEAHIRNWFNTDQANISYRWYLDGVLVKTGTVTLAASAHTTVTYDWTWTFTRHTLKCVIDANNNVSETAEGNNELVIYTDSISIGLWVEQSLYDYFNRYQKELGVDSTCWENWAQRQIAFWNDILRDAVYDTSPDGVLDRIRIDKIVIVADGALPLNGGRPTNHPDMDDRTIDLQWGFPSDHYDPAFYSDHTTVSMQNPFYYEGGVFHEIGHARYLKDVYSQNVHHNDSQGIYIEEDGNLIVGTEYMPWAGGCDPKVKNCDTLYYMPIRGLMNGDKTYIDRYSAVALNLIAGNRAVCGNYNAPCNIGVFINDLPENNILRIKDKNGSVVKNCAVSVYRAEPPEPFVWYGKVYDNIPDMSLSTDSTGSANLGRNPFEEDDDFHAIERGVIILRTEYSGYVSYHFLSVVYFNLEYWKGNTDSAYYDIVLDIDVPVPTPPTDTPTPTSVPTPTSDVPSVGAFSSAYGFGADTPGGRGGKVYKVVNLGDSGTGSFRWAVSQSTPRIIIFNVGGIIGLTSNIDIIHPYITIAGQTAPGDGIVLKNGGIHIKTHDVIIRHLSSRPGDLPGQDYESRDALSISSGAHHVIIDHTTLAWSTDEVLGFQESGYSDVTVQWCIIAEPLHCSNHPEGCHGYNVLLGGREPVVSKNVTMHHNLLAYAIDRNPRVQGVNVLDYRNNVTYGCRWAANVSLSSARINMVDNLYQDAMFNVYPSYIAMNYDDTEFKVYAAGNKKDDGTDVNKLESKNVSSVPFSAPSIPQDPLSSLFTVVTSDAGAIKPKRDPIDERLINRINSQGSGYINSPNDVGGYTGIAQAQTTRIDSDSDGLPDSWEDSHWLDKNDPLDANKTAPNGYTHIENWINELAGEGYAYPTPIGTATYTPTPLPTATPTDIPTATPTDPLTATPTDVPTATPPPSDNFVINPGFEDGAVDWGYITRGEASIVSSPVHSGSKALKLKLDPVKYINVYQYVPITAGEEYTVQIWIKAENITSGHARLFAEWYTDLHSNGGSRISKIDEGQIKGSTAFVKVIKTATAPSGAQYLRLYLSLVRGTGAAYFDDVSVMSSELPVATSTPTDGPTAIPTDAPTATPTDISTATPTDVPTATPTSPPLDNLVNNPGFEDGAVDWGYITRAEASIVSSPAHSGSKALKLELNTKYVNVYQYVAVTTGEEYNIELWIKAENIIAGHARLFAEWYSDLHTEGGSRISKIDEGRISGNTAYTKVE
ncbi:CARDB domain-containing protein, partial [Spirochaetota bacterium]